MFNFMKKAAEKDDKEKRKREKKERKDVKKRDRSSMSAEELLRLDEVRRDNVVKVLFLLKINLGLPFSSRKLCVTIIWFNHMRAFPQSFFISSFAWLCMV